MKYYLIAGEASGDLHGSNLMKALRQLDTEADFRCWGGDLMLAQGGTLVKHYKDLAFMGFFEVIRHLPAILGNLSFCRKDLESFRPDVVILIDYPGFNLRVAKFAHQAGYRVCYYISPQVWAWKKSRVYQIRRFVDRMFTILPFEKEFYARYDYPVDFVGHPLLDVIEPPAGQEKEKAFPPEKNLVAILPGSRRQEITRILPVMLQVVTSFHDVRFVVAGAPGIDPSLYASLLKDTGVEVVTGKTYDLLRQASAALVTSGTASLEAALFAVPQLICYKAGAISYAIARRIVDVKYIGLPNLIMDREIVRELIQNDLNPVRLQEQLHLLLNNQQTRQRIQEDYRELAQRLGGKGASGRVAARILEFIRPNP